VLFLVEKESLTAQELSMWAAPLSGEELMQVRGSIMGHESKHMREYHHPCHPVKGRSIHLRKEAYCY
jgi:hypothetical protein